MSLSSDAMAESLEGFNGTFLDREESGDDGIGSVAQISKPATGNEAAVVLARVINAPGPCVAGYRIDGRTRLPVGSNRLQSMCSCRAFSSVRIPLDSRRTFCAPVRFRSHSAISMS